MHEQAAPSETVETLTAEWLALYVKTQRSPRNVFIATQRVRDYMLPFFGQRSVHSLRPNDFRAYRLHLEASGRLAQRTIRHLLTDLRTFLYWLVESEILDKV